MFSSLCTRVVFVSTWLLHMLATRGQLEQSNFADWDWETILSLLVMFKQIDLMLVFQIYKPVWYGVITWLLHILATRGQLKGDKSEILA